uniref:Nucleotidyl transferase AbiEii toxin, Type IV TA system n=1 Tax=Mycobacterium riyadhense TaxID=486698 RepID=A0A653EYM1_9MYCO|nr:hypothetical protein BIN_B_04202 [Mycobacterium riyadhense]
MTQGAEFDPEQILVVLDRYAVQYVLVGGYAARLYGARRPTYDIDIAPSTAAENLQRLSAALTELAAKIRVADTEDGLPFACSAESLRGMQMLNLRTRSGDLDLAFAVAGFPEGYESLIGRAAPHAIAGMTVQVAGLQDVIKSKAAAGRPKDLEALPELIRIATGRERARAKDIDRGVEL